MDEKQRTWIACLTPPGRSAIATLGIRGPQAWRVSRELFQPAKGQLPAEPEPGRFWFGRLGEEGKGGRDEVVLAVRPSAAGHSIEVHCHGGPEVIRMLLELFAARGIEACSWQEWEERTETDTLACLAKAALAEAPTVRTAAVLLDQLQGAFTAALMAIQDALRAGHVGEANHYLTDLAAHIPLGRHLTKPWRVVIAGATNVGKSSLVNALAGYQRSVVDPNPGTTRDVVTTLTAIDGWPVELADTAGWRVQPEPLEKEGLARARSAADDADVCLWILDGSIPPVFPEQRAANVQYVINKIDLPAAWNWADLPDAVRLSAKTGDGVTELCQTLSQWLAPNPPAPGAAVPFTPRLCDQVETARQLSSGGLVTEVLRGLEKLQETAKSALLV
jgi:tRNA modification GTPase